MITRELKLKLTKKQERECQDYLWHLTGVYNWAIRTIKLNADNKIYLNYNYLQNITANHAKRIGLHSQVFQATLKQACNAWERCFKKLAKQPRFHSVYNKLRSFTFPQFDRKRLLEKTLKLPSIGEVRYHKQDVPQGQIKLARVVRKASGWYLQLTIDTKHVFPVKKTEAAVGLDTGFLTLATLSDGTEIENHRYYVKGQKRLAQAQRGKNKKLVTRLHERIANRRKDHNHKESRKIIENYKYIAITNDNLKGQSGLFGKSVGDAGISQLRNFIVYKGASHGRIVKLVESKNSTVTCSGCWGLTGPKGLNELAIRDWVCTCGVRHKRDVNSARVTLKTGFGMNLEQCC